MMTVTMSKEMRLKYKQGIRGTRKRESRKGIQRGKRVEPLETEKIGRDMTIWMKVKMIIG